MNDWKDSFKDKSFFYITPDVKRGLGLENVLPDYHIVCSLEDPLIPVLKNQGAKIFCVKETINNSGKLLEDDGVNDYIRRNSRGIPNILLFKPSLKTEILCSEKGYRLLVNNSKINRKYEDKISFHELIKKNFPQHAIFSKIGVLGELKFADIAPEIKLPFVVQFALGWAGKTTFLINNDEEFQRLIQRFPKTLVKISKLISGFTILNNACIYRGKIFISPPAFQVSGFKMLSENLFATCGREWPVKFLTNEVKKTIYNLTFTIGKIMSKDGYKGFFGLDFLVDGENGKVYVSENNARFTASCAFWTKMEIGRNLMPLIAYHLAEFLDIRLDFDYVTDESISATQIIFRKRNVQPKNLGESGFGVFKQYRNKWQFVRSEYSPENLSHDEIIYMKRNDITTQDGELSRIETKMNAIKTPKNLQSWVEELL